METLQKFTACDQWKKDGGQFIPHPATWLNQEGWDDEPEIKIASVATVDKKESTFQKIKRLEILDQRWAALKDFTTPEAATIRELRKKLRIEISEGK